MSVVIFARESLLDPSELAAMESNFHVAKYNSDIPEGSTVIGRYSVLPFYKWIEEDLACRSCKLINTYQQHTYIANFLYYEDVEDLTFKTWFDPSTLPENEAPFVVKGTTNSRKHDWKGSMLAMTRKDAIEYGCNLQQDSLIGQQDIIYRKYIPLQTFEYGINGLPFSNEWRIFVYKKSILSYGYYWTNAENAIEINRAGPPERFIEFANHVVNRLHDKLNFYVIDLAYTEAGNWILVEVNDAQMSGLSMNDPHVLYTNLKKELKNEAM